MASDVPSRCTWLSPWGDTPCVPDQVFFPAVRAPRVRTGPQAHLPQDEPTLFKSSEPEKGPTQHRSANATFSGPHSSFSRLCNPQGFRASSA